MAESKTLPKELLLTFAVTGGIRYNGSDCLKVAADLSDLEAVVDRIVAESSQHYFNIHDFKRLRHEILDGLRKDKHWKWNFTDRNYSVTFLLDCTQSIDPSTDEEKVTETMSREEVLEAKIDELTSKIHKLQVELRLAREELLQIEDAYKT